MPVPDAPMPMPTRDAMPMPDALRAESPKGKQKEHMKQTRPRTELHRNQGAAPKRPERETQKRSHIQDIHQLRRQD
jgi:hypothetical protein